MKAALYTRVSTLEQANKGFSLDAQREKLSAYAKSQGYEIFDVYEDDGYSGKDLVRPAVTRLLEHIKAHLVDVVIVYRLDRLTRRVRDIIELLDDVLEPNGVKLYSLHEQIDVSSPFGRAALKINATFSELERETITERMVMGKEQAIRSGKWLAPGKKLPFGYRKNPTTNFYEVIPEEADMVRKIYDLYLQGYSIRKLYEYASANFNHPYFSNPMCCKALLHRSMYAGYISYKGSLYKGKNFDPIIDYESYLRVQEQMKKNTTVKKHDCSPYLLTGLVVCAECGNRYVGKLYKNYQTLANGTVKDYSHRVYGCAARLKRDKTYHPAKCTNKIYEAEELEKAVEAHVRALKFGSFVPGTVVSGIVDRLKMELASLKNKREKVLDLYMEGLIGKDTYAERVSDIDKNIEKQSRIIDNEEQKIKSSPTLTIDYVKELHSKYDSLSHNEKRNFLSLVIDHITLSKDNGIVIKFKVK